MSPRRYYRVGTIHELETFTADGHVVSRASCTLDGSPVHVLSTHVNADDLEGAVKTLGSIIAGFDDQRDVFVDFYACAEDPLSDRASFTEAVRSMLDDAMPGIAPRSSSPCRPDPADLG